MRSDPLADPRPLIEEVYAYVAYRVGDGPDAEDVTSATFERAVRYRKSFDPRQGEPIAWLIGIARRCIVDAAIRGETPAAETPERATEGHEERSLRRLELHGAVSRLDERERELIALRFGADLTDRQIAPILEMSPGAVRIALHRALGRLRGTLDAPASPPESGRSPSPRFSDG